MSLLCLWVCLLWKGCAESISTCGSFPVLSAVDEADVPPSPRPPSFPFLFPFTGQDELERAAAAAATSWAAGAGAGAAAGGKSLRDVVTLSFDYSSTDVWGVAAAAATYLLGPGYAELRRGLTAPSTATRVETELRSGSDNAGRSTGRGSLLLDTLLGSGRGAQGLLELARGVFIGAADGKDLHHLDLLLRLMSEAAARSGVAVGGEPGGAARGSGSGSVAKKPIERRLNAHCGLVRRLLKAAPQGLDYKALVGEDPLADPLADPQDAAGTAAVAEGTPPAPLSNSSTGSGGVTLKRTAAGLAAARARAMAELRSVAGLEHAPALSKLAARIPGISGSAVYLAVGQRVLCGETGGLSPEALGLLRGDTGGDAGGGGGYSSEECEAASASVYHLLFPLFQKMGSEDLLEVTAAACAPNVAGGNDESLGYYPCRIENPWTMAAAPTNNSTAPAALHPLKSGGPFLDRMEPLHLTLRCRRRILAAASAASRSASSGGGSGGGTGSETGTAAAVSAVEIGFTRLKCLMDALSSLSAPWSGPATTATGTGAVARARVSHALEMAWAMSNRVRRGGNGADRESGHAAASVQQGAIAKAAGAATDMVLAGAPPSAVDGVCSCMQSALGVRGTEAAWEAQANADGSPSPTAAAAAAAAAGGMDGQVEATDVLNPSRVYATATSSALVRLVSQDAEDRTCALEDLWAACGAAGPSTDAGAPAIGAAKDQAWQVLAPILDMFGREGDLGLEGSGGGGGGNVAAPSVVLWARAEVLTLLRSFGTGSSSGGGGGGSGGSSDGRKFGGDGRVEESSAPYTANGSGGDVLIDDATVAVIRRRGDEDGACVGEVAGSGGGGGGRRSPAPDLLSVTFLRVAELAMGAFGVDVPPGDVSSWELRSAFLGTLLSTPVSSSSSCGEKKRCAARDSSVVQHN